MANVPSSLSSSSSSSSSLPSSTPSSLSSSLSSVPSSSTPSVSLYDQYTVGGNGGLAATIYQDAQKWGRNTLLIGSVFGTLILSFFLLLMLGAAWSSDQTLDGSDPPIQVEGIITAVTVATKNTPGTTVTVRYVWNDKELSKTIAVFGDPSLYVVGNKIKLTLSATDPEKVSASTSTLDRKSALIFSFLLFLMIVFIWVYYYFVSRSGFAMAATGASFFLR